MRGPLGNDLNLGLDPRGRPIHLSSAQRATHLYVCGSTGTGKTKFLENLIRQDIKNWRSSGCGLLLIDPHGSLYHNVLEWMAFFRLERPVIPIDLGNRDWVVGYNPLRNRPDAEVSVIVSNFVQAMAHVWGTSGVSETPLFARWCTNILRTLYEAKQTLVEAEYLIDQLASGVRRSFIEQVQNRSTRRDWRYAEQLSVTEYESQIGSTLNRLRPFLGNQIFRSMFGQQHASLDLVQSLERGEIILVNLSSQGGRVSDEDANLFASMLLSDLWTASKERGKGDGRNAPKPFYVYIDEFQSFVTPSIAQQLDQARGFGLHLTLAHQFPNQLINAGQHGKAIYDSIMVNARSKAIFQVEGEENLRPLAMALFMGEMNPDEIKHEIYSTKVLGHQKELRRSTSHSTAENASSGDGYGKMFLEEERDLPNQKISEFLSRSSGESRGYSDTEMEVDAAIFGKELASVQFRDLEEQTFNGMKRLFTQEQRTFLIRRAGEMIARAARTPDIRNYRIEHEEVAAYADELLQALPFAFKTAEAARNIERREKKIESSGTSEEPRSARRRIPGSH